MAWPPDEFPPVLETVPEDRAPTRLRHRDIAFRNVMIGDRDPAGPFEREWLFSEVQFLSITNQLLIRKFQRPCDTTA